MPLFKFDDRKVKETIKNAVGAKEGDFNGQSMMCGTTVNPVVVVNRVGEYEEINKSLGVVTQNVYYLVGEYYNCEFVGIGLTIGVADETVRFRITIDGYELTTATANLTFAANPHCLLSGTARMTSGTNVPLMGAAAANMDFDITADGQAFWLKGKYIKIEACKTTAGGAATLTCKGIYHQC